MDLVPGEVKALKTMVEEWHTHPERELETTFGPKGEVDTTTFLQVVQRLKAKGYDVLPQEDKLNICLPTGVRFSVFGLGVIQQYCRDNTIVGKPYQAIIKDKASGEANIDLDEYDVRIKTRREIPLGEEDPQLKDVLSRWPAQKKAFRMIRRWTFRGEGIRFDLSMVRSTPMKTYRDRTGKERKEFQWALNFRDFNFLEVNPTYEIEVELLHGEAEAAIHLKNLVRGMGEVLRGIQKSSLLTRKTIQAKVISEYMRTGGLGPLKKFRGVAPKTLQLNNMVKIAEPKVPNLREGYNVTDKADGLRVHAFCNAEGDLWMIDMALNVYRTGLRRIACANTLLDGEWITKTKEGAAIQQLLLFETYVGLGSKKVTQLPFQFAEVGKEKEGRHGALEAWVAAWNEGDGPTVVGPGLTPSTTMKVSKKIFLFGGVGDDSIFKAAGRILDGGKMRVYATDGLIFTSNQMPLPERPGVTFDQQFKWKPAEENTIDFLAITEKDPENDLLDKVSVGLGEHGETVRYKTLRLFVNSERDTAYDDPRATVLRELPLPGADGRGKREKRPALFTPTNYGDTMASVCYRTVEMDPDTQEEYVKCERSGEPIQDRSIVEMAYEPGNEPGWRWVPVRVRYDKTERLQKGILERTLNSEFVANDNWNSIYDPVTEHMIRTGAEEPLEEEIVGIVKANAAREDQDRKYYDRKGDKNDQRYTRGLQDFHNKWVKERIMMETVLKGGDKTLLDITCGKAGDLQKWRRAKAAFILGIDKAGSCILDPNDGAYRRLLNTWMTNGRENVPPMIFVIGDSSKQLVNGDAGSTPEEKNILRAVFGRVPAGGDVPALVAKAGASRLKFGADAVGCNFAIHYFFENKDTFEGFLENVRASLKVGGYFSGCCFDGETVFNMLRGTQMGDSKNGIEKDGTTIWTITKKYDADDLPNDEDAYGMAIDVKFISIGMEHTEYLVPFKLLVDQMKSIGCDLLNDEELAEAGLLHSTNMFENSYEMAVKGKQPFPMSDIVKEFSFLNRWFIFKRRSEGRGEAGAEGKEDEVPVASSKPVILDAAASAPRPGSSVAAAAAAAAAAAPAGEAPAVKNVYQIGELFQFFHNAALKDTLAIGKKGAARWLAPNAPFRILDKSTEPPVEYPSMEHYLAGMKYKLGANKPELAVSLFSRTGTIHQEFLRIRLSETGAGKRKLSEDREYELLAEEREKILDESRPPVIRRYKATFDEAKWSSVKDDVLKDAVKQRWEEDKEFQDIVNAARLKGKYLLYYSTATNDLGGVRRPDGRIEGDNKVGKYIMELAGF